MDRKNKTVRVTNYHGIFKKLVGIVITFFIIISCTATYVFFKNSFYMDVGNDLLESLVTSVTSTTTSMQDNIYNYKNTSSFYNSDASVRNRSIGLEIVHKAYNETYKILEKFCLDDEYLQSCMRRLGKLSRSSNQIFVGSNRTSYDWPWWFSTLLRDGGGKDEDTRKSPLFAFWHNLLIVNNPKPINVCSIEKIATTQFRKLQCVINTGQMPLQPQPCPTPNKTYVKSFGDVETKNEKDIPKVVFLRDPLERFLSAFLNKCISPLKRKVEKHCEPNNIYNDEDTDQAFIKNGRDRNSRHIMKHFQNDKEAFFEAYVDTIPFKWNGHFFPQGLYCNGLYRTIHEYDFIGYMNDDFYEYLYELGQKYSTTSENKHELAKVTLNQALRLVFGEDIDSKRNNNETKKNIGTETKSATHVKEYYTKAETIKKMLQYMSIDYVKLNLPIPKWADDILLQDEMEKKQYNH